MLSRRTLASSAAVRDGCMALSLSHSHWDACRVARRGYTPIFTPPSAGVSFEALHSAEEIQTLWSDHHPVSSLGDAVRWWIRLGNNPVVHTTLPMTHPSSHSQGSSSQGSVSPFSFVEDYIGTHLLSSSEAHRTESLRFWLDYFERRCAVRLRQSRRSAANHVGVAATSGGASLAEDGSEAMMDEADLPHTRWDQDTDFKEMQFLSQRHLRVKASTLLQLERALWYETESVEAFLGFFDALQQQRPPSSFLPLPVASVWYYEGAARQQWAEKYLAASRESMKFFQQILGGGSGSGSSIASSSATALLSVLADQLVKIHEVLVARQRRQVESGICPSPPNGSSSSSSVTLQQWCESEMERMQRSIEEGALDPEDLLDDSDAWKAEHAKIMELASVPLTAASSSDAGEGAGPSRASSVRCSYEDFWRHAIRREALETLHVWTDDGLRRLSAAAYAALLQEMPYARVLDQLVVSLRRGQVDVRAAVFRPHANAVWCKLHFAKFGGSSIAHHTRIAKRRLLYHYASSAEEVAATAALYFASKPLSQSVDYTTPFTLRRSLCGLCAQYGVDMMRATQRPLLSSAALVAEAEAAVATVCEAAAQPFGPPRRAYDAASRALAQHDARLLPPVGRVVVRAQALELFAADSPDADDLERLTSSLPRPTAEETPVRRWPLGGRMVVSYDWPVAAVEQLRLTRQAGPLTAERLKALEALTHSASLQVSLWRRLTPEEKAARDREREALREKADRLTKSVPALAEVREYATRVFERLDGSYARGRPDAAQTARVAAEEEEEVEEGEWTFVALLRDGVPLNETQTISVQMPFCASRAAAQEWRRRQASCSGGQGSSDNKEVNSNNNKTNIASLEGARPTTTTPLVGVLLPAGEYRLRLRAFDRRLELLHVASQTTLQHAGLCSDGFSAPFEVFDAAGPILEAHTTVHSESTSGQTSPQPPPPPTSAPLGSVKVISKSTWMTCCRALREAGVEVPLRTEFLAGQALTTSGDVLLDHFLFLLYESSTAEMEECLSPIQWALEPRCRAHWRLHHPGATEAEWASARLDVLTKALRVERSWWWKDRLLRDGEALGPTGVVPSLSGAPDVVNSASIHRYGVEMCNLLTAEGCSHARDPPALLHYYSKNNEWTPAPGDGEATTSSSSSSSSSVVVAARCTVNGRGELRSLQWEKFPPPSPSSSASTSDVVSDAMRSSGLEGPYTAPGLSLSAALAMAERAVRAAQDHHATRSMTKLGPMEREAQVASFMGVDGLEMGGKYARTYCYAVEKAKNAIANERHVAGRAIPGVRDDETARVSDGEHVDRFASSTHPEQRHTRFTARTTLSGQNIEDPTPDQESSWGR